MRTTLGDVSLRATSSLGRKMPRREPRSEQLNTGIMRLTSVEMPGQDCLRYQAATAYPPRNPIPTLLKWEILKSGRAFDSHLLDLVFADHQDAKGGHRRQRPLERVDVVVVQVDEDKVGEVG